MHKVIYFERSKSFRHERHYLECLVAIVNGLRLVIMNDKSLISYGSDIMNVNVIVKYYIYNHREWLSLCHREWIRLVVHTIVNGF